MSDDDRLTEADNVVDDIVSASASDPIMDWDGRPIEVGTRVRYFDFLPGHPDWGIYCLAPMYCGTVTDADPTDWDGDVDDEGRSYGIPPTTASGLLTRLLTQPEQMFCTKCLGTQPLSTSKEI